MARVLQPPKPYTLNTREAGLFRNFVKSRPSNTWTHAELVKLVQLVRMMHTIDRMQEKVSEADSLTTEGHNGQDVLLPEIKALPGLLSAQNALLRQMQLTTGAAFGDADRRKGVATEEQASEGDINKAIREAQRQAAKLRSVN